MYLINLHLKLKFAFHSPRGRLWPLVAALVAALMAALVAALVWRELSILVQCNKKFQILRQFYDNFKSKLVAKGLGLAAKGLVAKGLVATVPCSIYVLSSGTDASLGGDFRHVHIRRSECGHV